tara:strand:- start:92 stop:433 length:342 start_codon:yes stop_codon:yes gene_type:complete
MISETTVMMLIAIQFGFMGFVLMKIEMKKGESERLKTEIEKSLASIEIPSINVDEIKGELIELIEDLMSQIRIPTILDHVGGMASLFMQHKMAGIQQLMPQPNQENEFEDENF